MSDAIQLRAEFFTPDQEQMIRDMFLNGAPKEEAAILMELAKVRRLNPITKQIHFVKRWDSGKKREVWAAQVGIDGFRSIAERTGRYDGQDEPEYEYKKDGSLLLCRVRVYRRDWSRPAVGVAHWDEYVQMKKEGGPNAMWSRGKHFMLAKCAEAIAFRKAFPEDMSGLYTPEEMPEEREASAAPVVTGHRTAQVKAELAAKVATLAAPKALPKVIDVAPGETEAQAEQRAKPGSWPPSNSPWQSIQFLMLKNGKGGAAAAKFIEEVTGKKKSADLDANDILKVSDALDVLRAESSTEEPPPPGDMDAPGVNHAQ